MTASRRRPRWLVSVALAVILLCGLGCAPLGSGGVNKDETTTPVEQTSQSRNQPDRMVGLGLSRQQAMEFFDDFQFDDARPGYDGSDLVTAKRTQTYETLSLIGPPENLVEVRHVGTQDLSGGEANRRIRGLQAARKATLLMLVLPEWERSSEWLIEALRSLRPGEEAQTVSGNSIVTLKSTPVSDKLIVVLIVRAIY